MIQRGEGLMAWLFRKRQDLGEIIDRSLSAESASLHKAIIPGLKRGVGQEMRDAFSRTGLAHLLSISGTHFGLLAFIIFNLARTIIKGLPRRVLEWLTLSLTPTQIAILLTMPVLGLYAMLSGAATPTVRSFIMVSIYMIALFIGRRGQWLNSLSVAALIILLWNPGALFELSFQLSFLAVFSIGTFLEKKGTKWGVKEWSAPVTPSANDQGAVRKKGIVSDRVTTALFITVAAILGTAPVVALVFKQFPLISPVTNLILTPVICFVILPLGFFTGFTALILNMDTMPLSEVTDWLTRMTLHGVKLFSEVPYASLHVPNPSFLQVIIYFIALFILVKGSSRLRFIPVIVMIGVYLMRPYMTPAEFRVTFLDVGQGDASLVETPDREVILIDGGRDGSDAGRRVIAPYLWAKGIGSIDYVILSHPHSDHYGGLLHILDHFDTGEVWHNGRVLPEAEVFFTRVVEKGIPLRILRRGDVVEARGYRITALHPYDGYYSGSHGSEVSDQNSDSLVLKVESGDLSVLFTGDIELEAEEDMMHLEGWIRSDIIKVPHHGGRSSSSVIFIEAVDPDVAVISAGKSNSFGHPHEETLRRYKQYGVRTYRTDLDGAVTILKAGKGYDVKTSRDFEFQRVKSWQDELRNLKLLL
jgi:competence protein ComEC